jgi:hypothetical protein
MSSDLLALMLMSNSFVILLIYLNSMAVS